jgi:hypothetical protein
MDDLSIWNQFTGLVEVYKKSEKSILFNKVLIIRDGKLTAKKQSLPATMDVRSSQK